MSGKALDAGHSTITTDHPDAVLQAIRDLPEEVRGGPAGPDAHRTR
ncbi:MAG: hypothetical protein ACLP8X_41295 [Streptosporangiaceae bacterium]|jgi:hypothetical protein